MPVDPALRMCKKRTCLGWAGEAFNFFEAVMKDIKLIDPALRMCKKRTCLGWADKAFNFFEAVMNYIIGLGW